MKHSVGDTIVKRLQGFAKALENDEPLQNRFNCRIVELDLQPKRFGGRQVKQVRNLLGLSQSLFAQFIGVNVKTVQSWEQNQVKPSEMACRFLSEIEHDPAMWRKRLTQSMVIKETTKAASSN